MSNQLKTLNRVFRLPAYVGTYDNRAKLILNKNTLKRELVDELCLHSPARKGLYYDICINLVNVMMFRTFGSIGGYDTSFRAIRRFLMGNRLVSSFASAHLVFSIKPLLIMNATPEDFFRMSDGNYLVQARMVRDFVDTLMLRGRRGDVAEAAGVDYAHDLMTKGFDEYSPSWQRHNRLEYGFGVAPLRAAMWSDLELADNEEYKGGDSAFGTFFTAGVERGSEGETLARHAEFVREHGALPKERKYINVPSMFTGQAGAPVFTHFSKCACGYGRVACPSRNRGYECAECFSKQKVAGLKPGGDDE